ncbi:MAG: threonine synthase [Candidatus Sumerlaeota bacterium]|nr:threonine synthase [Candidatus Sumerlaeota bacterium]
MASNPILFYSTNDRERRRAGIDFCDALMQGLAPDKGLYMADRAALPRISDEDLRAFASLPYSDVAFRIVRPFVAGRMPDDIFHALCRDAYNYEVPIENYASGQYLMRLDRGPTASFKDFAARMMARLMQYFLKQRSQSVTILTATSGDTGGAVAAAFHGLDSVRVIVLFPGAEVSARQRRQMTTLGGNVFAVDIAGKFDDCQALVKQAFVDPDLSRHNLTSANSINVGRLIPQSVYYAYAASRILPNNGKPLCVCVPSGNFGNLMGGLLAKHSGLPIAQFIAAVNENDEVPVYLQSERYQPIVPSRNCLSNAMNVGHPSNLARLVALYGGAMDETGRLHAEPDMAAIRRDILSVSVSDAETRAAIADAWRRHHLMLEPHGAVGYKALDKLRACDQYATLFLETAHPAKFPEVIREVLGMEPELPDSMRQSESLPERKFGCACGYDDFKSLLVTQLLTIAA